MSTSGWSYPYWTSRQFLTYELAKYARIQYATDRFDVRDLLKQRKAASRAPAPFSPPPGLTVVPSRWPRTYRYQALDRMFEAAYIRHLQRQLDAGGTDLRVIYAWHPSQYAAARQLSADIVVYHPYDMFRHFVDSADSIVAEESALCELADAVVTPHRKVAEALKHPNTHVINNGVFLPAFPGPGKVRPREMRDTAYETTVGYVGAINDKIDFELVREIFGGRPDWQAVFVGFEGPGKWKSSQAYEALRELENVSFHEGVPINQLAPVIAGFDIGIVPYSLTGWAKFSESPLKLYQYWAMGVPVVCSPLPGLTTRRGVVEICRSSAEWHDGIERQLAARKHPSSAELLRHIAEDNSWATKAEQVMSIIQDIAGKSE